MSAKEYIQKTRDLLQDPDHWLKGNWGSEFAGAYCMIGALRHVSEYDWDADIAYDHEAYRQASTVIASCIPEERALMISWTDPVDQIIDFNDNESTRHEDVIRVLTCALEKIDAAS